MASDRENEPTSKCGLQEAAESLKPYSREHDSYRQILKSSVLIGGSSVFTLAIGMIRTKAMALLLGPAGFGLMGLYWSVCDVAVSVAGMGVNASAVRQIAESAGSGDSARVARTIKVVRLVAVVLGTVGAFGLFVASRPISTVTFGDDAHSAAVAMLSFAVLFRIMADAHGALLQGMRRIADLVKGGVLGAFFGTILSIALVYWFGEDGVVPSVVSVAFVSLATSWWYSSKVQVPAVSLTLSEINHEARALLTVGFVLMANMFFVMGSAYAVRTMVLRAEGLDAAGLYSAAWTLGGLYIGIIVQAMATDFYPRLTAAAKDDAKFNRLVNDQVQVGLLLAGPGVIATLIFAPLIVPLFYSSHFNGAVDLMRWICLGMGLRVIAWPMGLMIVAKKAMAVFFWTELTWASVHICLAWICIKYFGLSGAGVAFLAQSVFHSVMTYAIVRPLSGFRLSDENKKVALISVMTSSVSFCGVHVLPTWAATIVGGLALVSLCVYALRAMARMGAIQDVPQPFRRVLALLGCAASRPRT